jgi:4-hydroxy 2-oxovalerate aldolase
MDGREVLILGTGPGVGAHRVALEAYIRRAHPIVMALNTQEAIEPALIDLRIACHPVRLLADAETHAHLPQPLITPASMLPTGLRAELGDKTVLDFGLGVDPDRFAFHETHCIVPTSLVLAYALAVATSGQAAHILMAGFDGYPPGDPRNDEIEAMLATFATEGANEKITSITPTSYKGLPAISLYGL